jgi:hypothetical protein
MTPYYARATAAVTKLKICKPASGNPMPLFGSNPFDTDRR